MTSSFLAPVRKSPGLGVVLIILLTVLVYIPAMRGGFVYDDNSLITNNQIIKSDNGLYRFWFTTEAADYYPLTWSLWWLEWRWWGNNPLGYHVVNVLLHAGNAVLVWLVLRALKIPGAWLTGVVFAIHPVNVATVAWISEQKNTLSMLFLATAVLLYLRFDEERRWHWYGLALMAFLLAVLIKSAVVMLPVVLLICVWWRRGKVRQRDLTYTAPFFALSLVFGLATIWFQQHRALEDQAVRTASFAYRLVVAGWVPWFYLYKALLPLNLTVIYPKWEISTSDWVNCIPGAILVGCFVAFFWKRRTWGRPLLFGAGYFVVMLFPVLGFFDQGFYRGSLVADHWQYYSIVGVIALVIAAVETIGQRMVMQRWLVTAALAVLVVLTVGTWRRGLVYANDETLWRDNVAKKPNAWAAHYNLGVALGQTNRMPGAIAQYEQALRVKPDYVEAHDNLGDALMQAGRFEDAIGHFEQSLRIKPNSAEAHTNLGVALSQMGKVQEAIDHHEQSLGIKPSYPPAQNNLAWLLATIASPDGGDPVRAVVLAQRACELTGNQVPEYLDTLAAAYAAAGRFNDAVAMGRKAVEIASAHNQTQLVREIKARLRLYQNGQAYRQFLAPRITR